MTRDELLLTAYRETPGKLAWFRAFHADADDLTRAKNMCHKTGVLDDLSDDELSAYIQRLRHAR